MTREDINDIINAICPNDEDYEKPCISPKYLRQELEQLALDQKQWNEEPTTKNDLGVDCVARQDVERYIEGFINEYTPKEELEFINLELDGLKHIPSVTPQEPRKGHWITRPHIYGVAFCSECGFELKINDTNYCPNCGAKMESED